eukprot:COSAG02_NODE_415_length_22762_cov_133.681816_4_plen_103_part_00
MTQSPHGGGGSDWGCAVCNNHDMHRGRHYASFTLRSLRWDGAWLGLIGPDVDPRRCVGGMYNSKQAWMLSVHTLRLVHHGGTPVHAWEGQPKESLKSGDVLV